MKDFKVAPAQGEESTTDEVYVDAAGKAWPVYTKRILIGAMPNATTKNTLHTISNIKLDGGFRCLSLTSDNGTNSWDERCGSNVAVSVTTTNLVVVSTADLSTHLRGLAVIAYCKTTD
jgi:hypothetical protein